MVTDRAARGRSEADQTEGNEGNKGCHLRTLQIHSDPSVPIRAIRVIRGLLFLPFSVVLAIALWPSLALAEEPSRTPAGSHYDLPTMLFVFMLASFIGLGVITRVSRLLHTPLMSLTNAISAIAIVGAITVAGVAHGGGHSDSAARAGFSIINFLGAIALFASTVNIVSGFLITDRMLKMFKKK